MAKIKRIDLCFSLFNEKLFSEAKANIEIVSSYFRASKSGTNSDKVINQLLKFIEKSDYSEVTPSKITYELQKIDELLDEEVTNLMSRIKYFVKLTDKDILGDYARKLEESCKSQAMKNAQEQANGDVIKLLDILQKFDYKSAYSDEMTIVKMKDVDSEKAMRDSFSKFANSDLSIIRDAYPAVEGWLSSQMIMVVGRPGGGKSLFMMRTAIELCKQGKRGLYVALGDLTEASFIIRMGAQVLGIPLTDSARRSKACMEALINAVEDRLSISCVAANKLSIEKCKKKIKSQIDQFDFLIFDYDANFKTKGDASLYIEGGEIYSDLSEFTVELKKLVFVGCQPKQSWWDKALLPMNAGGESSRKQQFIDTMITIGVRARSEFPMGYINIAKNRNGKEHIRAPYFRTSDGDFHIIPSRVYEMLKDYHDDGALHLHTPGEMTWNELSQVIDKQDETEANAGMSQYTQQAKSAEDDFFEISDNDDGEVPF